MDQKKAIKQLKKIEEILPEKDLRLAAEWDEKWKILIATILSSQTKDEKTIDVCENYLFRKFKNLKALSRGNLKEIEKIIHGINYYKTKARNIKETARIIVYDKKGKIPDSIDGLLELPGVGRKVANVYLVTAFNADAIGVDTHVARISRKLGWTKENNRSKIEKDLEKLFPREYWNSINWILVRFGRTTGKNRKKEDEVLKELT